MSDQTPPTMPPVPAEDAKAKKAKAKFVFVLNELNKPVTLLWRPETKLDADGNDITGPCAAESKILGPGFNYVAAAILPKCTAKGEQFGDAFGGRVREQDPRELPPHVATELAKTTASRQAAMEWRKIETRDSVRKALDERLLKRGPRSESTLDD